MVNTTGLRPPWPKGVSGNPSGQPGPEKMLVKILTERYKKLLLQNIPKKKAQKLVEELQATGMEAKWADAVALGQVRAAVRGSTPAAKELADRVEGKVIDQVDLTTTGKELAASGQLDERLLTLLESIVKLRRRKK